jgi:hypothetical protein
MGPHHQYWPSRQVEYPVGNAAQPPPRRARTPVAGHSYESIRSLLRLFDYYLPRQTGWCNGSDRKSFSAQTLGHGIQIHRSMFSLVFQRFVFV